MNLPLYCKAQDSKCKKIKFTLIKEISFVLGFSRMYTVIVYKSDMH